MEPRERIKEIKEMLNEKAFVDYIEEFYFNNEYDGYLYKYSDFYEGECDINIDDQLVYFAAITPWISELEQGDEVVQCEVPIAAILELYKKYNSGNTRED